MIIRELYMKNFGQFCKKNICLKPGINLIRGRNESGKSTTAEFVRSMLFGMKKARGRGAGKDLFSRCTPWAGGAPEGSLTFSCRKRNFRISRRFPDQAELFCTDDGEILDAAGGDLEVLLGGIREGLYRNTVYTGSGETVPDIQLPEELTAYFLNMESVQEEQADVQAAEKYLKERARILKAEYRSLSSRRQEQTEVLRRRIEYLEEEEAKLGQKLAAELNKAGEAELSDSTKEPGQYYKQSTPGKLAVCVFLALGLALGAAVLFWNGRTALSLAAGILSCQIAGLGLYTLRKDRKHRKSQSTAELARMERSLRLKHLKEEAREKRTERENCMEELEELDNLPADEAMKRQELEACEDAAARIRDAARELSGEWAHCLEREASDILNAITGGRYQGLKIGERMDVTVMDRERVYSPDQLSWGTKEQIFMAVRLSAAMLLSEEPMPLIFDDAFLAWDDDRLEMLLQWMSVCERQVLLFTVQDREEELMRRSNIPYCKIVLDEQKEPVYV